MDRDAAQRPYCTGGTGTCDICVGSCGIEEHEASAAPSCDHCDDTREVLEPGRTPEEPSRMIPCGNCSAAEVRRPDACPKEGEIAPFDAGWLAHELGFDRETVRVLAADPEWSLLGYDARAQVTT